MNNARTPLIILTFLVIASLLMSVYFVYQPDYAEIIYLPQSDEEDTVSQKMDSDKSSESSDKTSKTSSRASSKTSSKTSSKSSRQTSSKVVSSKPSSNTSHETSSPPESVSSNTSSEMFSSFDDFSYPPDFPDVSWSSSVNSSLDSSRPPTSSSTESEWNPESAPDPPDSQFEEIQQELERLQLHYGVSLQMNVKTDVIDPDYGVFTDVGQATVFLGVIRDLLEGFPTEFVQALTAKNYPLGIFLTRQNPSGENVELQLHDQGAELIIQYQEGNVAEYTYRKLFKLFDQIISEATDINVVYAEYVAYNPPDFVYGIYAPDYIFNEEKQYFLNIASQSSIVEDRAELFVKSQLDFDWREQLKEGAPLSQKLQTLEASLQTYLLSH